MKMTALLLLAMSVSVKVLAQSDTVKSINLYEPPKSASISSAEVRLAPNRWQLPPCLTCADVADIQTQLSRLGYKPGRVDGLIGPIMIAAIKAYQTDQRLPVDGQATDSLLERLRNTN